MLFHKQTPPVYRHTAVADFHAHILPGMDDGARDAAVSLAMLEEMYRQGVRTVVATPHFYPNEEDPAQFLSRRIAAAGRLLDATERTGEAPLPAVFLGAEVAYYNGIGRSRELAKLTVAGTKTVLIEMPFDCWPDAVIGDLLQVRETLGLWPVIAHIERYIDYQRKDVLAALGEADILIQANAEAFLERKTARAACRRLRQGRIDLLGSDAHGMHARRPNLGDALNWLSRKLPAAEEAIASAGAQLLAGALPLAEAVRTAEKSV